MTKTFETRYSGLVKAPDNRSFRPSFYDLSIAEDSIGFSTLFSAPIRVREVHDTFEAQVRELLQTRSPRRKLSPPEMEHLLKEYVGDKPPDMHGMWVFYPWSGRLVHVLDKEAFRELRSSRNRYKITPAEQIALRDKRIGVVGLSVGQASAVTMALEGVGGEFRLADFDELALSNMNRLRAGVHEIGLNKCVIAARQIAEIDPYVPVTIFEEGITAESVEVFLGGKDGDEKLDLLVEECDDMYTKLFVRERAKALSIPVIMETNDRGMLDVERFDLEPERPILHGLLGEMSAERLKSLPIRDKLPYMLRLLGPEVMQGRASASLFEVEESITSWPQLASGTVLGGALTTDVGRRILLGEHTKSGRYFADLGDIVKDGGEVEITTDEELFEALARKPTEREAPPPLERASTGKNVLREDIRRLVGYAALAPSGGNAQPFRFVAKRHRVRCFVVPERGRGLTNFKDLASFVAVGAAVENMTLAAQAMGLSAEVKQSPDAADPLAAADVTFSVSPRRLERPALVDFLDKRVTNRRLVPKAPLPEGALSTLSRAAEEAGGRLQLVTDPRALMELADIVGQNERGMLLSPRMNKEMGGELRWTEKQVRETRDGIDVLTLDLPPAGMAAVRMASSWEAVEFLSKIEGGAGQALGRFAMGSVALSSAMGLLVVKGNGPESYFQGGRAVERVWLTATSLGLSMQPWSAMIYLFARLERGGASAFEPRMKEGLLRLRERFRHLFEVPSGDAEVLLFRLFVGPEPAAKALRRDVSDILSFEG